MINLETQKMYLRAKVHRDESEIKSLRGTKAIRLRCCRGSDEDYEDRDVFKSLLDKSDVIDVTTWSSLVRNAIDILKKPIMYVIKDVGSEEFLITFDNNIREICEEAGFRLNTNCPKRLFREAEETDLIKSTVYLSNKNHMIEVFKDEDGISWYVCAVYTVEIVVMLEALLDTIYDMAQEYTVYKDDINSFPHYTFELSFVDREQLDMEEELTSEINEQIKDVDNEMHILEMSKDLLQIQGLAVKVNAITMELFDMINKMQKKYNLKNLDEILGYKN